MAQKRPREHQGLCIFSFIRLEVLLPQKPQRRADGERAASQSHRANTQGVEKGPGPVSNVTFPLPATGLTYTARGHEPPLPLGAPELGRSRAQSSTAGKSFLSKACRCLATHTAKPPGSTAAEEPYFPPWTRELIMRSQNSDSLLIYRGGYTQLFNFSPS